jgi:hypothetical protein
VCLFFISVQKSSSSYLRGICMVHLCSFFFLLLLIMNVVCFHIWAADLSNANLGLLFFWGASVDYECCSFSYLSSWPFQCQLRAFFFISTDYERCSFSYLSSWAFQCQLRACVFFCFYWLWTLLVLISEQLSFPMPA